jgi:hypothetical protein
VSDATVQRRIAKLEISLTPTQAVIRWLDEAHAFPSLDAYTRAMFSGPLVPTPLDSVVHSVEAGIRESMKGQPRDAVEKAVTQAARQAVFRCLLALRLNEVASEQAKLKGVTATALFFWMRALASDGMVHEMMNRMNESTGHETSWSRWREAVSGLLTNVYVEDEARLSLEREFLDGHPSLFADVMADWTEALEQAERVARLAAFMDQVSGANPVTSIAEIDLVPRRAAVAADVAKRATYLADMARARTLDMCRQEERALQILARHFGGDAAHDPAA